MRKCPNCGYNREDNSLECRSCGHKAKLSEALTNPESLAEPPIEIWAQEMKQRDKPSAESMREVRAEHRKRQRRRLKRKFQTPALMRSKKFRFLSILTLILGAAAFLYLNASPDQKNRVSYWLKLKTPYILDFQEGSRGFAFIETAPSGVPAFWHGCKPLTYEVRVNYANKNDLLIVQEAFDEISMYFKRKFEFIKTTESPNVDEINSDILIDFTSLNESQTLTEADSGLGEYDVAGVGSPTYIKDGHPLRNSLKIFKGQIWIEESAWLDSDYASKKSTIMHEIGHVIGLTHPEKKENQVMGYNTYAVSSLGEGDILGIRILSAIAGCQEIPKYLQRKS